MLKTIKDVAMAVAEHDGFSTTVYDALCELELAENPRSAQDREDVVAGYVEDFLDSLADYHTRMDAPEKFAEELFKQDFDELRDNAMEWADSYTEVYNWKLWRNAPILQEFIEDAMAEYGNAESVIKNRGLVGLFAQGECYFWDRFAHEVIGVVEELKEKYDEEMEEAAEEADAIDLKIDYEKETKRLGATD